MSCTMLGSGDTDIDEKNLSPTGVHRASTRWNRQWWTRVLIGPGEVLVSWP